MEGKFSDRRRGWFGWFLLVCGVVMVGMAGFVFFSKPEAPLDDVVPPMLLGVAELIGAMFFLRGGRRSFLRVDENGLEARQFWRRRRVIAFDEIAAAGSLTDTWLTIILKNGKAFSVFRLENASEIAVYIQDHLTADNESRETQLSAIRDLRAGQKRSLPQLIIGGIVLIVFLVLLIVVPGKSDHITEEDLRALAIFGPFIVASLLFILRISQKDCARTFTLQAATFRLHKTMVLTAPLPLSGTSRVFTDIAFTVRVSVITLPNSASAYYAVETFTPDFELVVTDKSDIFDSIDALMEELEGLNEISLPQTGQNCGQ